MCSCVHTQIIHAISDSRAGIKIDIDRDLRPWIEDSKGRFYKNGTVGEFEDCPMFDMRPRQVWGVSDTHHASLPVSSGALAVLAIKSEQKVRGHLLTYIYCSNGLAVCYGHITTKAAPLIRTGNLNVVELHQYWVE